MFDSTSTMLTSKSLGMVPIECPGGTTNLWQLIQLRAVLKLELKGMRHSRSSASAHVKRLLGLPKGKRKAWTLERLEWAIADAERQLGIER